MLQGEENVDCLAGCGEANGHAPFGDQAGNFLLHFGGAWIALNISMIHLYVVISKASRKSTHATDDGHLDCCKGGKATKIV